MKVRSSKQAGKGDKLRKGANLEAYWNNYDNIFRKCKNQDSSKSTTNSEKKSESRKQ